MAGNRRQANSEDGLNVVRSFIEGLAAQSDAVRKVRDGGAITAADIEEIVLLFEGCEHPISIENLREAWGAKRVSLEEFLAHILRGESLPDWETKVKDKFEAFIQEHSTFVPVRSRCFAPWHLRGRQRRGRRGPSWPLRSPTSIAKASLACSCNRSTPSGLPSRVPEVRS